MKKVMGIYSCILLCAVTTSSSGQQLKQSVISSGGGISKANNITLEWTLGEPVIEVSSVSNSYTQGFHQPVMVERKKRPFNFPSIYHLSVAPNPVVSQLNVNVHVVKEAFQIRIVDAGGTVVYLGKPTKQSLSTIDVSSFKNGSYFLSILDQSGNQLESFKVIKLK